MVLYVMPLHATTSSRRRQKNVKAHVQTRRFKELCIGKSSVASGFTRF